MIIVTRGLGTLHKLITRGYGTGSALGFLVFLFYDSFVNLTSIFTSSVIMALDFSSTLLESVNLKSGIITTINKNSSIKMTTIKESIL